MEICIYMYSMHDSRSMCLVQIRAEEIWYRLLFPNLAEAPKGRGGDVQQPWAEGAKVDRMVGITTESINNNYND